MPRMLFYYSIKQLLEISLHLISASSNTMQLKYNFEKTEEDRQRWINNEEDDLVQGNSLFCY